MFQISNSDFWMWKFWIQLCTIMSTVTVFYMCGCKTAVSGLSFHERLLCCSELPPNPPPSNPPSSGSGLVAELPPPSTPLSYWVGTALSHLDGTVWRRRHAHPGSQALTQPEKYIFRSATWNIDRYRKRENDKVKKRKRKKEIRRNRETKIERMRKRDRERNN